MVIQIITSLGVEYRMFLDLTGPRHCTESKTLEEKVQIREREVGQPGLWRLS